VWRARVCHQVYLSVEGPQWTEVELTLHCSRQHASGRLRAHFGAVWDDVAMGWHGLVRNWASQCWSVSRLSEYEV